MMLLFAAPVIVFQDLYQFDDLDSLSFYPPLMACHPTSTSGQQYSHYAFPAFNSHSVRSSSPSLGSRQEHWDKRSDQPLSSRKHVAERRRPSSLGGTARTSSSVPPSGSTAGSGGGDSRLASARVRTAETEDERHAEVPPVLPLLDWKSFYVYDCIVDELKVCLSSAASSYMGRVVHGSTFMCIDPGV